MHPVNEVLRSLSPRRVADTVDRCSRFRYAKPAAFAVQSPSAASLSSKRNAYDIFFG